MRDYEHIDFFDKTPGDFHLFRMGNVTNHLLAEQSYNKTESNCKDSGQDNSFAKKPGMEARGLGKEIQDSAQKGIPVRWPIF
jgi:hypothetical protein